jgi:hypothetical protein
VEGVTVLYTYTYASEACYNAEQRADYAESHPWRNLRALLKRKLKMA